MMRAVDSRCPVDLFVLGKDRSRHLELAKLSRQCEHSRVPRMSLRHLVEAITQCEKRIQRYQSLIDQYRANPFSQLRMDALSVRAFLVRSGKQLNNLVLRAVLLRTCCNQNLSQRAMGRVEQLCR